MKRGRAKRGEDTRASGRDAALGFTLVELVIVIVVIAIGASLSVPTIVRWVGNLNL
ncbi:MAG: prepilin-type N-terminal cleavage/methylation domain-containing protein, partial [Deltaproteobacteria bacterium]|nr:prepilin-type N-terminal cleavage/methylation domain-containing protein [Deltaproteobacteria bacterium]